MKDLISVIVPVYNVENYLNRCVDSILSSTYESIELILVDDGSTDGSAQICDDYAKKFPEKVKVYHIENGGQSNARNYGVSVASGSLIGFVDSDDSITPDMYEYLFDVMDKYDVDISMCSFTRKFDDLDVNDDGEVVKIYDSYEDIMNFFYRLNGEISFYSVWNRLYKKELIQDVKFLDKFTHEDCYYTYEVYKKSKKIAVSNLKKYFYFKNNEGITRQRLSNKDEYLLRVWDLIVEKEQGTVFEQAAIINRKRASFTLLAKAFLYGKHENIDFSFLTKIKKEVSNNFGELMKGHYLSLSRKVLLCLVRLLYCW